MSEKLNVLSLSSWYPPKDDPLFSNFIHLHVQSVATLHNVYLVIFEKTTTQDFERIDTKNVNINIIRFMMPARMHKINRAIWQRRLLKSLVGELPKIDIIHCHVIFNQGWLFTLAKKFFNAPLIVSEQANDIMHDLKWYRKLLVKLTLRYTDKITVVGSMLGNEILKRYNFPSVIVPNIAEESFFKTSPSEPENFTFCHVSTMAPIKNVTGILNAFTTVLKEDKNIRLKIVSDQNTQDLRLQILALNIYNNVDVFDRLLPHEVAKEMASSSAFVMNSFSETFSVVLSEAIVLGLPIISTNVGLLLDIEPKPASIIIVEVNNEYSMIEGMKKMLSLDKASLDSKTQENLKNTFRLEKVAIQFDEVFKSIKRV